MRYQRMLYRCLALKTWYLIKIPFIYTVWRLWKGQCPYRKTTRFHMWKNHVFLGTLHMWSREKSCRFSVGAVIAKSYKRSEGLQEETDYRLLRQHLSSSLVQVNRESKKQQQDSVRPVPGPLDRRGVGDVGDEIHEKKKRMYSLDRAFS